MGCVLVLSAASTVQCTQQLCLLLYIYNSREYTLCSNRSFAFTY